MTTDLAALKRRLRGALSHIAGGGMDGLQARLRALYADDPAWRASRPMNEGSGIAGLIETVWAPLMRAFPDLERRDDIFVAGRSIHAPDRPVRVAAMGHLCGTFREPWLGIAPSGQAVFLRYGEVHEMEGGRIARTTFLVDVLDLCRQVGLWPMSPSPATECMWPAPRGADGVRPGTVDEEEGERSIRATLDMHRALADFDDVKAHGDGRLREALLAMPQRDHWHERMMWYGPSGVGTTRGLEGFVEFHQAPFRVSFPNRKGGATLNELKDEGGGGHYVQIGDGRFSVTGGWPSVRAVHRGGEWLGQGASGNPIAMRVMDFYAHDEGLIRENWVPIDIVDVLHQMGFDAIHRVRRMAGETGDIA